VSQAKGQRALDSGNCKSCGAAILWVVMGTGARMPLDPKPQKLVTLDDMPEARGYVHDCYASHFATCPNAAQHRKSK